MNTLQSNKGFTIIEVVLVLAIAGLIFLMVFVALPALQAGQRDTARKGDVGSVASAINTYTSSKRGALPTTAANLGTFNATTGKWSNFLTAVSANTTTLTVSNTTPRPTSVTAADSTINVIIGVTCGTATGLTQPLTAGSARQYVVVTKLEAGGGSAFCQES